MKKAGFWIGFLVCLSIFTLLVTNPGEVRPSGADAFSIAAISTDTLRYDSFGPAGSAVKFLPQSNYWVAVKFADTVLPFTLEAVQFLVDNSQASPVNSFNILVTPDDDGKPTFPVPAGKYEGCSTRVLPVTSVLRTVPLNDTVRISRNEPFWIVLGPVPGGPDNGPLSGWWGMRDTVASRGRSLVSLDNRSTWDSLAGFTGGKGNWVLRALGQRAKGFDVVINEVMFRPDTLSPDFVRNHQWVELYNPGSEQDRDLVQLLLTNRPMTDTAFIPRFTFPLEKYLLVHFYDSAFIDTNFNDGKGEMFLGEEFFFNPRSDACALFSRDTSIVPPDSIRDIISWNASKGSLGHPSNYPEQGAELRAVNAGIMGDISGGDLFGRTADLDFKIGPLIFPIPGMSIGRDSNPFDDEEKTGDQDAIGDFEYHGGLNAFSPTPGRINRTSAMQASLAASDPVPQSQKAWTLMLYVAGDGTAPGAGRKVVEPLYYDLLNQLEASLPVSPANVNVVLFFDGGRILVPGFPDGASLRGAVQYDASDTLKNLRVAPGTEINTSDSAGLRAFLTWAMDTFPAQRYALAVKSDGWGWKGILTDGEDFPQISFMEMKDLKAGLKAGLNGVKLDLLLFDAPLMGQIEVATQVDSLAHYMAASGDLIEAAEIDYSALAKKLEANPSITGRNLVKYLVDTLIASRSGGDPLAAWTALDLNNFPILLAKIDSLALNLRRGIEDVCGIGDSTDNFQLKIREALVHTAHYGKQQNGMADFIDLKNFVSRLLALSVPGCGEHRGGAASINSLLADTGSVLAARLRGSRHSTSGGLSIYFPSSREKSPPVAGALKDSIYYSTISPGEGDFPYDDPRKIPLPQILDLPFVYAADLGACYPHAALPSGFCTPADSTPAREHPLPATAGMDFVSGHGWDEFLIRYYKPVADAGGPFGTRPVNQTISFNASGSSDADSDSLLYFWDLFPALDSPLDCDSVLREDLDKNCVDGSRDDRDLTGRAPVFAGYQAPNDYLVTLHVWDSHDINQPLSQRSFQTDSAAVLVPVRRRASLVEEDEFLSLPEDHLYENSILRAGFSAVVGPGELSTCPDRMGLTASQFDTWEPVFWQTGRVTSCLFPVPAINAFSTVLNDTLLRRGAWVFSPALGQSWNLSEVSTFFRNYFKVDSVRSGTVSCTLLVPRNADSTFLLGLNPIPLKPGTALHTIKITASCDYFPVLFCNSDTGQVVAAAAIRDLGSADRGAMLSTFGLEHILASSSADTARRLDTLLARVTNWLAHPTRAEIQVKGDMNNDCLITSSDVVLILNCIFLGIGDCQVGFADMNCDSLLTSSDVVLLLNYAFLGILPPC